MGVRPSEANPPLSEASREERAGPGLRGPCGGSRPGRRRPGIGVRQLGWLSLWAEGRGRPGRHCLQFRRPAPASLPDPGTQATPRFRGAASGVARGWRQGI